MTGKKATGDAEVGYGKPPKHRQFKRGQSGNPNGRPKAAKSGLTDIAAILDEPLTVRKAGATESMSPFEVSVRQLVKRALGKNDLKAILEFVRLCERYKLIAPLPPSEGGGPVLVVPKTWDWNEWLQMFEQHGPPPWPGKRPGLVDEPGDGPDQGER
jgi:Family of unknown function (DUF5681)